jgi:hypothetical protein
LLRGLLLTGGYTACACASQQSSSRNHLGVSAEANWEEEQEKTDESSASSSETNEGEQFSEASSQGDSEQAPVKAQVQNEDEDEVLNEELDDAAAQAAVPAVLAAAAEERRMEEYAKLARLALHQHASVDNHLGVRIAVSERAADLPWILAVENTSPRPVQLAAIPSLLRLDLRVPSDTDGQDGILASCASKTLPRRVSENELLQLAPGQLLFFPFDPRRLCSDSSVLKADSEVTLTYGFPIENKKLWKGGKLVEVEKEQTAPFVAEAVSQEEFAGLKNLISKPFILGATYPLSKVSLDPEADDSDSPYERTTPPPPLSISIADLGSHTEPEQTTVQVTVRNVSSKTLSLFLRRELISYEVIGPWESVTCRMSPSDRAPDASAFSTLSPSEPLTLVTRLAEACPPGTWDVPGSYSVSARLTATSDGGEFGLSAFVGDISTKEPAQLLIPGKLPRPVMRIAPSQPEK